MSKKFSPLIRYSDLDLEKVIVKTPVTKTYTAENGTSGSYTKCEYAYASEQNSEGQLKIELCKVKCSPIRKSGEKKTSENNESNKKTYDSYYTFINFDINDPTTKECLDVLDRLHMKLAKLHEPYRASGQLKRFMNTSQTVVELNESFKSLVKWEVDPISNIRYQDKNPTKACTLNYYTDPETKEVFKARFKTPAGEEIDWEILQNSNFEGYPVINFKNSFYSGKEVSTQSKLVSMVVTSITKVEYRDLQEETIKRINSEDPQAKEIVLDQISQIAKMINDRRKQKNKSDDAPLTETPYSPTMTATNNATITFPPAVTTPVIPSPSVSSPVVPTPVSQPIVTPVIPNLNPSANSVTQIPNEVPASYAIPTDQSPNHSPTQVVTPVVPAMDQQYQMPVAQFPQAAPVMPAYPQVEPQVQYSNIPGFSP